MNEIISAPAEDAEERKPIRPAPGCFRGGCCRTDDGVIAPTAPALEGDEMTAMIIEELGKIL